MGSLIVRTWIAFSAFILSITAASVEDFPEPVGPVTSTIPLRSPQTSLNCGGKSNSAKLGTFSGITRITMAQLPRWRKMFTRNRAFVMP